MKRILLMLAVAGLAAACDKADSAKTADGPKYEIPEFKLSEDPVKLKRREDIELTKVQEGLVAGTADFAFICSKGRKRNLTVRII